MIWSGEYSGVGVAWSRVHSGGAWPGVEYIAEWAWSGVERDLE